MASPSSRTFGDLLKGYRMAAGLTQEALAECARMSARGISDLERGARRTPYKGTIEALASALQLTDEERAVFFTLAGSRNRPTPGEIASPHETSSPVVGRKQELARLQDLLAGKGLPVLLLAGEPGMGKTWLLRESAVLARKAGWTVLEGSCSRHGGQLPYTPFLEALAGRMRSQPEAQVRADLQGCNWLARLLPELAEQGLLSLPTLQVPPEQERRLLFASVARYLHTIAGPAGTLLLLDDLQWGGADAFDLLISLMHASPSLRVIAAYRNTEFKTQSPLSTLIADLAHEQLVTQIELAPLAYDEARQLLKMTFAEQLQHEDVLIEYVLQRAGGVPFFLVSCARGVQSGALTMNDEAKTLPWDVQQVIRQRIAVLPPMIQHVLSVAAIIGRAIPFNILAASLAQAEPELIFALETSCQARLLLEETNEYVFAHDLIREVIEADLSNIKKRSLHRLVASSWEQCSENCPPEVLAYHYGQAGEFSIALNHLIQAAHRARQAGAHHKEAELLKQSIDFAQQTGQHPLALDLQIQRGIALRDAMLWADAHVQLTAALEELQAGQEPQRIIVLNTLAQIQHWLLNSAEMRRSASEALKLAQHIGRDDLEAQAMCVLAQAESSDGETKLSLSHVHQALAHIGNNDVTLLTNGVLLSSMLEYWLGHFEDAATSSRRAFDLASQSHDTFSMAQTLGNLGLSLSGMGRYAEAFSTFGEACRMAQERGSQAGLARTLVCLGGVHLELFDFAGAEAIAQEARETSRSARWLQSEISAGIDLLFNFARRGDVGLTERLVKEVAPTVATAQGAHGWLWRLRFITAKAEIALARGAWAQAVSLAEEALVQSRRTGRLKYQIRSLEIRARALVALGRVQEAITVLQEAMQLVRTTTDPMMFLRVAGELLRIAGDDGLLLEAQVQAQTIALNLPDEQIFQQFIRHESIRSLLPSTMQWRS